MPCIQESVGIQNLTRQKEERGKEFLVKGKVMVCFKRGGNMHIHIFTSFPSEHQRIARAARLHTLTSPLPTPLVKPHRRSASSPSRPPKSTPIGFLLFPFPSRPSPSPTFPGTMFFDRYKEPTFLPVPATFFFSLSSKAREASTFLFCVVLYFSFPYRFYEEQVSTICHLAIVLYI